VGTGLGTGLVPSILLPDVPDALLPDAANDLAIPVTSVLQLLVDEFLLLPCRPLTRGTADTTGIGASVTFRSGEVPVTVVKSRRSVRSFARFFPCFEGSEGAGDLESRGSVLVLGFGRLLSGIGGGRESAFE